MRPLKLGLMGCGRIAQQVHLNILKRLPGVQLVAVAEVDPGLRHRAVALAPRAIGFDRYEKLLEMPQLDAVVICLPNALHADATIAALDRGMHVYLEKPLATNLADARRVLDVWKRTGLVGMIGFNYRFNLLYQAVRAYLQSGRLGDLISARSVFSTVAADLPAWKRTRRDGGGVLLDLASHHVDLIHFLLGQEVREVFAGLRSQRSEDDTATLELRLADGLLVQSFFSMSAAEENRFEIYGQLGKITADDHLSQNFEVRGTTLDFIRIKRIACELRSLVSSPFLFGKLFPRFSSRSSYGRALAHFAKSARNGSFSGPDFWDGYRSLRVIKAAEESNRVGKLLSLQKSAEVLSDAFPETVISA